jgi:hypothetical protein
MVLAAACTDDSSARHPFSERGTTSSTAAPLEPSASPEVVVEGEEGPVTLTSALCAGGCGEPDRGPTIGVAAEVRFRSAFTGWASEATLRAVDGSECPRRLSASVERQDDGSWVLRPAGKAGTYDVTLVGNAPNGRLLVTFRWTTTSDGRLPTPQGRLAVLAGVPSVPDSYGVELYLSDLRSSPADARAQITVHASAGGSLTFEAVRAPGCWPEGDLFWDGPDEQGRAAAAFGPGLFTYEVEVTLDGEGYRATAEWPRDTIVGNSPSVRLDFSPPLPALE